MGAVRREHRTIGRYSGVTLNGGYGPYSYMYLEQFALVKTAHYWPYREVSSIPNVSVSPSPEA